MCTLPPGVRRRIVVQPVRDDGIEPSNGDHARLDRASEASARGHVGRDASNVVADRDVEGPDCGIEVADERHGESVSDQRRRDRARVLGERALRGHERLLAARERAPKPAVRPRRVESNRPRHAAEAIGRRAQPRGGCVPGARTLVGRPRLENERNCSGKR